MTVLDDDRWIIEKWNELWTFMRDADERGKRAEQRAKDATNVHRDGWKLVAESLGGGLKLVAEAVREHGRR